VTSNECLFYYISLLTPDDNAIKKRFKPSDEQHDTF